MPVSALAVPEPLLDLVRARDPQHALDVALLTRRAARAVGVSPDVAFAAGLVHDVGKLAVPEDLLGAQRALTATEWSLVRVHPVEEGLGHGAWPDAPREVLHAVCHHHERLDGRGYPDGLRALPRLTSRR